MMKKLMTLLVAVLMVLTMAGKAMAEETYTITIDNALKGEEYSAYKIFDVTYSGTNENPGTVPDAPQPDPTHLHTAYAYTIVKGSYWWTVIVDEAEADTNGVYTANGLTFTPTTTANLYSVTATADFDPAKLAKTLNDAQNKPTADKTAEATGTSLTLTVSSAGYYFVDTTAGSLCSLDTTEPNAVIREKNTYPTLTKAELDNNTSVTAADIKFEKVNAQIGDTIWFKLVIKDGKGTDAEIYVNDVISKGLTLNERSFVITVNGTAITPVYTGDVPANGCKIELAKGENGETAKFSFGASLVNGLDENKEIVIVYSATVNEKAVPGTAETNKAKLTYQAFEDTEKTVEVYTYKFEVLKYDAKDTTNKKPLAGAEFQLLDGDAVVSLIKVSDTEYRVAKSGEQSAVTSFTTVASGNIVIKGVDVDKNASDKRQNHVYSLKEIAAPEGYNPLPKAEDVIVKDDNKLVVEIPNESGAELPSTGGIGTTIFHVAGALLVLGAGIVLISKKRANNN